MKFLKKFKPQSKMAFLIVITACEQRKGNYLKHGINEHCKCLTHSLTRLFKNIYCSLILHSPTARRWGEYQAGLAFCAHRLVILWGNEGKRPQI